MSARVYRIQVQRYDGTWLTAPGDYRTEHEAVKDARIRCTLWRIVTGSGKIVKEGPSL